MSAPPYAVHLKGGAHVTAVAVEVVPGWCRALVPRTHLEVDEAARVGRQVTDGAEWISFPAGRVLKVVGPVEESS